MIDQLNRNTQIFCATQNKEENERQNIQMTSFIPGSRVVITVSTELCTNAHCQSV